eukprot:524588_1
MSYNPLVSYAFNPGIITSSKEFKLSDGWSAILQTIVSNVHTTQKEMEWLAWIEQNPSYDSKERREWLKDVVCINDWQKYAFEAAQGKINEHLVQMFMVENSKLSSSANCIHHTFGGPAQCVDKLTAVLLGSPFGYRDFLQSEICYDCLMMFCSQIQFVEKSFDDYYKQNTNWNPSGEIVVHWVKELYYLSNCLLKYQSFVNYVLCNEKLYANIFSLFVYYMKNFNKLESSFESNKHIYSKNDQGYYFTNEGIHTLYTFEYNFCGILSCIRKLMCYFKPKHLYKLIEMDYFKYFLKFINKLFEMKYIKILTDAIIPGPNIEIRGTITIFATLSVVHFINFKVLKKIQINRTNDYKMRKKLQNVINKIKENNKHLCLNRELSKMFKHGRYLLHDYKYPFMMSAVNGIKEWNIATLLKQKSFQMRKYKCCGNSSCSNLYKYNYKNFKLCSQCRIVYYCSRKCQKQNWVSHRLTCK